MVRIQWRSIAAADRLKLEQQFGLAEPVQLEANEWIYVPVDLSSAAIRALVTNPSVADTDGLDRRAFTIAKSPPLTERRGGLIPGRGWMARAAKGLAYGLFCLAGLVLMRALVALKVVPPQWRALAAARALVSDPIGSIKAVPSLAAAAIERAVPVASAEAAALFRIVFGAAVLLFIATHPVYPDLLRPYEVMGAQGVYGVVVRWFSAHPAVVRAVGTYAAITGVLFVAGLFTRISYACFVCAFLLWAAVFTVTTSTHVVGVLGVTLIGLLAARWGDAYSVDAWLRRRFGRGGKIAPGSHYGFAIWVPRLVMGVAFLAAAWAKMEGGFGWILNGTVKYHFISDLDHAMVAWGPWLTRSHTVAVLMSGGAVAIEALLITGVFSRSQMWRLVLAGGAAALLTGFVLFQGVLWWGWWIVLVSFLPWERFRAPDVRVPWQMTAAAGAGARGSLLASQLLIVLTILAQQLAASAAHIEARPLVSAYDMYSATYASPDDYENAINLVYRLVVFEDGRSRDVPGCVVDDRGAALVREAAADSPGGRERVRSLLGDCLGDNPSVTAFALEGDRQVYSWERQRFEWKRSLDTIGPFPAAWLR
jgi:hypothetical protein